MVYTEAIRKSMILAYEVHSGQLDKAGYPYIHHPMHVAEQVNTEEEVIVALLHDVLEDVGICKLDEILKIGVSNNVIEALDAITRREDEQYFEYIDRVAKNRIARKVKIADLKHNLDTTRVSINSSLVNRYKKALRILTDTKN